jgi:hypothetical protein
VLSHAPNFSGFATEIQIISAKNTLHYFFVLILRLYST